MSALTITPTMRFNDLRKTFAAMIPSTEVPLIAPRQRRRKRKRAPVISATQARHIARAANKQQVIEMGTLERALGANHDRNFIEQLKVEVREHLVLAGVQFKQEK